VLLLPLAGCCRLSPSLLPASDPAHWMRIETVSLQLVCDY
jgi:hypothetical protein